MDSLFDPTCVPVWVTINKLNLFPNRKMPRFVSMLRTAEVCVQASRISLSCSFILSCIALPVSRCILCRAHMEFYRRHRLV